MYEAFCQVDFLAAVHRLPSIRPVLQHTDREVRPPEEGTGGLRRLHPVLYCTTGDVFTPLQNKLERIILILLYHTESLEKAHRPTL